MTNYDFISRIAHIFKGWENVSENPSTIYLPPMILKKYKDFHFTEIFLTEKT